MGLSDAAEKLGYKTLGLKIDFTTLIEDIPLPCICHWNKYHFVTLITSQLPASSPPVFS